MKNIFYHYTAKRFIPGIKKHGLTEGRTPIINNEGYLKFIVGTQWISKESNPDNQLWAIPQEIDYSRRQCRLLIDIPEQFMKNVMSMDDFMEVAGHLVPEGFNDFPDETKDWYIYYGRISSDWIKEYMNTGLTDGK